jgi:hypothetical protein
MTLATFRGILLFFFSSFPFIRLIPFPRVPYINHTPLPTVHPPSPWGDLPSPRMDPPLLPPPPSQHTHDRTFRRWSTFLRSSPLRSGAVLGALIFASLVVYTTFLSPHGALAVWHRPPDWHGFSQNETSVSDLDHASPSNSSSEPTKTAETSHPSPSPSPISDVLNVEQIRDIVAPTRGFFTRDYSLGLGWNNVGVGGVPI